MLKKFLNFPSISEVEGVTPSASLGVGYQAQIVAVNKRTDREITRLVRRALPLDREVPAGTFKLRYILGEGYPHVSIDDESVLRLFASPFLNMRDLIALEWAKELDLNKLPKYRVVLEKITE